MREDARPTVGTVVWHHLVTNDPDASAEFYGQLFLWEFRPWGDGGEARQIVIDGVESAGLVPSEDGRSFWLPFVWVDDLDAVLTRVVDAGGEILEPEEAVSGFLRSAIIADPQGALIAPLEPEADLRWPDGWTHSKRPLAWHDLLTPDVWEAARFYDAVFGWNAVELDEAGYLALEARDHGLVAGIAEKPEEVAESLWLTSVPLFEVDFDYAAERAPTLGAELLVEVDRPEETRRIYRDPTGAVFGIL